MLDQTPGMLGGTKTLNVRRTGIYANQSLDGTGAGSLASVLPGSVRIDPVSEIDQFNKILIEENMVDLIKNTNSI